MNSTKTEILKGLCLTAIGGTAILGIEYIDFTGSNSTGRDKNAISNIVSGIVAQKVCGGFDFEVDAEKTLYFTTKIQGNTDSKNIKSSSESLFSSVNFQATQNEEKRLEGKIVKSDLDWNLKQIDDENYKIGKSIIKPDYKLNLEIGNNIVSGVFDRNFGIDWKISGNYSENECTFDVSIDGPLTLGVDLVGKINKK